MILLHHVIDICNRHAAERGAPVRVFVGNGSEFSGRLLDPWACQHKVRIDFSRPGRPTDNCFVATFNGSRREECLNTHWLGSLEEAKHTVGASRRDYNESQPHQGPDEQTPAEFARSIRAKPVFKPQNSRRLALAMVRRTHAVLGRTILTSVWSGYRATGQSRLPNSTI